MTELSILVPTYQEVENIPCLIEGLMQEFKGVDFEVVVIDDSSPDGTARVVRELARKHENLRLLERPDKMGLGSAVMDGLDKSAGRYILMMDADLSHRPQDARRLLEQVEDADIVVGSRYVPGGACENWPFLRRIASRVATFVVRLLLNVRVKDSTSGLALYRRELLEELRGRLTPRGFKLLLEILVKARGAKAKEVPIIFVDRAQGSSKFGWKEVRDFIRLCWNLRREQADRR